VIRPKPVVISAFGIISFRGTRTSIIVIWENAFCRSKICCAGCSIVRRFLFWAKSVSDNGMLQQIWLLLWTLSMVLFFFQT
jgi:hypothetical protein